MSREQFVPQQPRALISRTTVLILASLLIWVGAGSELPHTHNALYLLLGVFGMVAYLALERAAYRRLHQEYSTTQALYRLEQRLHAQQEQVAETRDRNAAHFSSLLPSPARAAENGNGSTGAGANILRMPLAPAGATVPDETFLTSPTTRTRLA
jgi:hypothetical protein